MEFLRSLWAPIRSRLQYGGGDIGGSSSSCSTGSAEAFTLLSLANQCNLSTMRRLLSDPVVAELRWKYIDEIHEMVHLGRKVASALFQTPLYHPLESIIMRVDEDVDTQLQLQETKEDQLLYFETRLEKMKDDPLLKPYIDVVQGRAEMVLFSMTLAQLDWFSEGAWDNLQDNVYSLEDIGNFIEELNRAFNANPLLNSVNRLFGSFDDHSKILVFFLKLLEVACNLIEEGCYDVKFHEYFSAPVIQEEMKNLIYNYSKCSLHEAAGSGDIEMLQKLLKDGANKDNLDCGGKTALHYACIFGFENCTKALLEAGCDVFVVDVDGNTALHYAAAHGRHGCVELLLKSRAAVSLQNKKGETPIDIAKSRKHYDVLLLLEEAAFSCKVWPFELENEPLLVQRRFWNNMLSFKSCF